ncbi:O-antigen ligase [Sphingosinicella sp. CPCC 101087]|uniref:O-antigen ligase family protein n=1 Tax=Sphingosinicella sp. CPCC 101087 TaxID=2497754 RepID=UPI00101DE6B9|nr:O-antigen ligase family protein [Sphingosinicella sp. CPCC 101087]
MRSAIRPLVAATYLILCLVFGGASSAGILGNLALQLLGAAILAILLFTDRTPVFKGPGSGLWWLALGWVAVVALQLVPLPPRLWTSLPGREAVVQGFALVGVPPPWLGISLTPDHTIRALVSILPIAAIVALVAPVSARSRQLFLPLVIAFAMAALLVGLIQKVGGPQSPLYFYAVTNWGQTVGFFSNRNHQATLLLMTLPFVAALATPLLQGGRIREEAVPKIIVIATLFAVIAGGVMMTGSRAGIALVPIVTGLCTLMVRKDLTGNVPRSWVAVSVLLVAAGIAAVAASGVVTRDALSQGNVEESTREAIWGNTIRLAVAFQPVGGGLGSFVPLYRIQEDPHARPDEFTNHAHNDYLEWVLETGLPGLLLLATFLFWYVRGLKLSWSATESALGRAGSIAIVAVLLHSLVDYPVRTAAIAAFCALCLGLMVPAPETDYTEESSRRRSSRRSSRRRER